jgi:hypothetical protein
MDVFIIEKILLFCLGLILFAPILNLLTRKNKKLKQISILTIVSLGLGLRIYLAFVSKGNFDMRSYEIVSKIFLEGKNVYAETGRYNYSPIWFLVLGFLKILSNNFNLYFPFLIGFILTVFDSASLYLIFKICKLFKKSFFIPALLFFLNPISILLTSHHRQFENITSFFVVLGIYLYIKKADKTKIWFSFLLAGIIKHLSFNQVLVGLNHIFKKKIKVMAMFLLSVLIFLLTFVPYVIDASNNIIKQVFLYKGYEGIYGPGYFISLWGPIKDFAPFSVYPFIIVYFLFALFYKSKIILRTSLVNSLFFLSFTSGYGDQYFVLPVAVGAIIGGFWFYLYTLVLSLFLFGAAAELGIEKYSFITHTMVWFITFAYFISELLKSKRKTL